MIYRQNLGWPVILFPQINNYMPWFISHKRSVIHGMPVQKGFGGFCAGVRLRGHDASTIYSATCEMGLCSNVC